MEQLYLVSRLIDKDIDGAIGGVLIQIICDKTAKAIETLAHIGGVVIQMKSI